MRSYRTIGPEIRGRVPAELLAEMRRIATANERSVARELSRAIRVYLAVYDRADEILRHGNQPTSTPDQNGNGPA